MIAVKSKKKVKKAVKHPAPEPELLSPREAADEGTATAQGYDGAHSTAAPEAQQPSSSKGDRAKDDDSPTYDVEGREEFRNVWGQGD